MRECIGEVARHRVPRGIAFGGIAGHGFFDDRHQLIGNIRPNLFQRGGGVVENFVDHRDRVGGLKWQPSCEQFIHRHTERINVGLHRWRLFVDLLGRHVGGRADEAVDLGMRGLRDLRSAKIGNLDVIALGQQNICGFDVAMNHTVLERIIERATSFENDQDRLPYGQQIGFGAEFFERSAAHIFHHDVAVFTFDHGVINANDIGV